MNPVLLLLLTVSEAWSASTLPRTANPMPLGAGRFDGLSVFESSSRRCLNSLVV